MSSLKKWKCLPAKAPFARFNYPVQEKYSVYSNVYDAILPQDPNARRYCRFGCRFRTNSCCVTTCPRHLGLCRWELEDCLVRLQALVVTRVKSVTANSELCIWSTYRADVYLIWRCYKNYTALAAIENTVKGYNKKEKRRKKSLQIYLPAGAANPR